MNDLLRAIAFAAAVSLVGCSSPDRVSIDSLEEQIPAELVPSAPETVTDVECNDEFPLGEGLATTCEAELDGVPISLEVTQLDDDASLSVELDRRLVDVGELAEAVGERFSDDLGVETYVACAGPPVLVAEASTVIDCTATDPSGVVRALEVTLLDETGTYTVTLS